MESPLLLLANISMSYMGPLISALTTILTATNLMEDIIRNQGSINEPGEFAIFDFIVVGSGSAGGVIANRLSESGKFQVALLEAGGDPTALNDIPYFMTDNLNHPETDWVYRTVPQNDSSQSLRDNSIILNRGKSLGGTSNLNYMVYMRGNPKDFDNWANLTQDEGWSYENLLPYFKKSENYQGNFKNESFHGTGGPLTISTSDFAPLLRPWLEAAKEMGFHVEDPNAMQSKGFSQVENTIKNGKRCSVYEAFIKPALTRENLKVIRYAHVTRDSGYHALAAVLLPIAGILMIVAAAKIDNAAMDILDRELDLGSYSYSFVNLSSPLTFPPIGKDVLDDRKREIRKQAKYYNKLAAGSFAITDGVLYFVAAVIISKS